MRRVLLYSVTIARSEGDKSSVLIPQELETSEVNGDRRVTLNEGCNRPILHQTVIIVSSTTSIDKAKLVLGEKRDAHGTSPETIVFNASELKGHQLNTGGGDKGRHVRGNLYNRNFGPDLDRATNELVIRVQPGEAIFLKINKVPGLGMRLDRSNLNLHYAARYSKEIPDAYERLLLDAIEGERRLFIRSDDLDAAWV
ncbi:hypothetical protein F3Y22_tig00111059pilonHSYRG00045 [Hibiscus syriacus]|uniref:Glucose-6-phosphate dehydrogenase C-terminal domain-containing protein n=1 Tax=Hibiscus syriacus TaxID=106335 RepID=A0A6A2Z3E4_HIBSY|nr:hypothetical protein F3Y22_tig00111059pilonHSYRG00045 [Hibiscus syriacus]